MNMRFKKIVIDNFCSIGHLETDLWQKTLIKGANAVGKSTIKNAIMWLLTDKLADGSSADGIRPHDESGKDIDFVDISVALTVEVDGREIELKKTQKQNWVKDRTTQEQRFKGNDNEYEINGIPKKLKDYKAFLDEIIPTETLMYCTNPMVFLKLDTKKRRNKLFELVSSLSNDDVIATDIRFEVIRNELLFGTVEELIARCKKAIKELKERLSMIPARIDEISKQRVDTDVSDLELEKKSLEDKISEVEALQNDATAKYKEKADLGVKIMDLKFKQGELQRNANAELEEKKRNIQREVSENNTRFKSLDGYIKSVNSSIENLRAKIEIAESDIKAQREEYTKVNSLAFDDSSLVCSYCGQEYPEEKKAEIKEEFEKKKAKGLKTITDKGNSLSQDIKTYKSNIEQLLEEVEKSKSEKAKLDETLNALQASYEALPDGIDVTGTEEYLAITKEIESLEEKYSQLEGGEQEKERLLFEKKTLQNRLNEVAAEISKSFINNTIDERIAELTADQKDVSQKIADQEKMLDLLSEFNRVKIGMVTDLVNSYFSIIKWQMFKEQVNGDYAEVCNPMVDGTSYDGLLNHGNRLLAEIDICKAFQKANNVVIPVFLDDSESVDSWRIPDMDSQLLMLRRTDDKELQILEG